MKNKKTADAIVKMLDKRIARLEEDRLDALAKSDYSGQIAAIYQKREAVLIQRTIQLGEF